MLFFFFAITIPNWYLPLLGSRYIHPLLEIIPIPPLWGVCLIYDYDLAGRLVNVTEDNISVTQTIYDDNGTVLVGLIKTEPLPQTK